MKAPRQIFLSNRKLGDCATAPILDSTAYLRLDWLINTLRRERLSIRKHLKDPAWREEWRDLKVCEQLYSEFLYRLHQLKQSKI